MTDFDRSRLTLLDRNQSSSSPAGVRPGSEHIRFSVEGSKAAAKWYAAPKPRVDGHLLERNAKAASQVIRAAASKAGDQDPRSVWITENLRLIRTAQKEMRYLVKGQRSYPAVTADDAHLLPRVYALALSYLETASAVFDEETLEQFVNGFQRSLELEMSELWALKPALQFALVEWIARECQSDSGTLPAAIESLRRLGESEWKRVFEALNLVDRVLSADPAQAYSAMDFESRDIYRVAIADLAKHSPGSERQVAEAALSLAEAARQLDLVGRAKDRCVHVGFYLIDRGLQSLRERIGYRTPFTIATRDLISNYAEYYYIIGIEVATFAIIISLLSGLGNLTPIVAGFFLLLLPASQAAVDFINNLTTRFMGPRSLPKLDFSEGIPDDCATMVAVPTLLLNERQVRDLVMDLEIRFLANRDPNLYFALVTDAPDSDQEVDDRDVLVNVCMELITDLNERYGTADTAPFYLFHRHRVFNPSEGRWMGWERKRGKLLDLNQLLRGGFDSFPVKLGDLSVLPSIRYIITLDSDTQLPRDTAHRMIGTLAHPLNRAVVDPQRNVVVEGYGILQPRIGISIQSASRSRLASLYSGQTGFDIYTRAVSDVYQDLFGEGIFTGKGIYEVDVFRDVLEKRFPDNTLLSHDLIEGAYARAGLVSDIEVIDDYPSHFSAYSRRKHRWVRGDWQITRWLLGRVPDYKGRSVPNPINVISRWKILDNLRRSLFDPAALILFVAGWLWLPGSPLYWTLASVAMLLLPVYSSFLFTLTTAPFGEPGLRAWARDTLGGFARGHVMTLIQIVFLLHQALLAIDAIWRSLARSFITKKRLLQWETAAEAEVALRKKSTVDVYLEFSPLIAAAIAGLVAFFKPQALSVAAPFLVLWFVARWISAWLNREPRAADRSISVQDVQMLRTSALRTWRYFHEWSTAEINWLIPDNVREDGTVVPRVSPTNLGFLLNARIAAVQFGYLTVPEFIRATTRTLDTIDLLAKHRGHLLNWYDGQTLKPLDPRFVSSVDSGNLAACLWTLKQAAKAMIQKPPADSVLQTGLCDFAEVIAASGGSGAASLRDRVTQAGTEWKATLPDLEQMSREYATTAASDAAWWAGELTHRIEATREWLSSGMQQDMIVQLRRIAAVADRLVRDMDFSFLYQRRKKVLSVGYSLETHRLDQSCYDLLASEARAASFIAIAKGDLPQESWFHLGRKHTLFHGHRMLVSWTGTMFEYLMPVLWMRHYADTIIHQSTDAVVRVHREFVRQKDVPWGISESSCVEGHEAGDYGYAAFGLPELAMKRMTDDVLVISPYSTFLALAVDPKAALHNLREMSRLGWNGRYDYYEAVDFRSGEGQIVRSWMAHHLGMSLLAVCNVLFGNALQNYFHAEPHVLATELLLHERVPKAMVIEAEELPALPARAREAA